MESLKQNTILKFIVNAKSIYYLHKCTITHSFPGCSSAFTQLVGSLSASLKKIQKEKLKNNNSFLNQGTNIDIHHIATNNSTITIDKYGIHDEPYTYCILEQGNDSITTLVEFRVGDISKVTEKIQYVYHNYNGQGICEDNPDEFFDDFEYDEYDPNDPVQPFPGDNLWVTLSDYKQYLE